MFKKSVCLFMVLILLVLTHGAVADAILHAQVSNRYTYVSDVYSSLSISGGTASCGGKGRGMYTDTTTHILVTLQRKPDGGNTWYAVKSWTAYASGIGTALVSESWPITTGNSYRIRVRCQIKDSDGKVLETVYCYSNVQTA